MEGTTIMANNAINSTNFPPSPQLAASRLPAKIPPVEVASPPIKKDTLELSDAALQLKAASSARTRNLDAAVKSARTLATVRAQQALQAAKERAASNAKKAAHDESR
jgi:hypothetical protein